MSLNNLMQLRDGNPVKYTPTGELYVKGRDGLTSVKDGHLNKWATMPHVGWTPLQGEFTVVHPAHLTPKYPE